MNCIKCPIIVECEVSKMTTQTVYVGGLSVPIEIVPQNISECPLLQAKEVVVQVKEAVEELKRAK